MNKKKKTILLSTLGVLLIVAIIIGTTYAFWKVTKVQEGEANTLTTTCLDVDLTSMSSGINLDTQFPITDEEGRQLSGYTFKISNKCNTYVLYDINLESLNNVTEANRLNLNDLVAIIDDGNVLQLGYYPTTSSALKTEDGTAYDTRKLITDILSPGTTTTPTSKEYTLRVWLDEDANEETMRKEWNGKISITASPVIAENAVAKLTELAKTNTEEMFTDDTEDANIRYMGKDPANYVTFTNEYYSENLYYGYRSTEEYWLPQEYMSLEMCQKGINGTYNTNCTKIHSKGDLILWRVIGVMNNVDDGTGKKETRIKLIRDENIGTDIYSEWCENGEMIFTPGTVRCTIGLSSSYINNWETSDIKNLLNNEYYNKLIGTVKTGYFPQEYNQLMNYKPNFTNAGMINKMKELIGNTVYYLGGPFDSAAKDDFATWTISDYYKGERNPEQVYEGHATTWTGKVGLIYPSDYGYATNGGNSGKEYCNNLTMSNWSEEECGNNSWIFGGKYYRWDHWMMTPLADNEYAVLSVEWAGNVSTWAGLEWGLAINPVVYLKSEVNIMGGNGTKANPYKLGL